MFGEGEVRVEVDAQEARVFVERNERTVQEDLRMIAGLMGVWREERN